MFGFSWSEILIIGVVALVLIGPNDLPRAMRTAAKWMSAGRKLAREFQGHVDDLVREAELDELRERARKLAMQPLSSHLESLVDPDRDIARTLSGVEGLTMAQNAELPAAASELPPPAESAVSIEAEATTESADTAPVSQPSTATP